MLFVKRVSIKTWFCRLRVYRHACHGVRIKKTCFSNSNDNKIAFTILFTLFLLFCYKFPPNATLFSQRLKVVTNEKGEAVGEVVTILC
jgi:hypothetical protein